MNNQEWKKTFREKKRQAVSSSESELDKALNIGDAFYDEMLELLQERYHFSIYNPTDIDTYSLSLWENISDERDRPVMVNTGGLWQIYSEGRYHDQEIKPSRTFFTLIGYGYHNLAAMTPTAHDFDKHVVEPLTEDKKVAKPELELANMIHSQLFLGSEKVPEELGPIVSFADVCTQFGVPEVRNYDMLTREEILNE